MVLAVEARGFIVVVVVGMGLHASMDGKKVVTRVRLKGELVFWASVSFRFTGSTVWIFTQRSFGISQPEKSVCNY